MMVRPFDKPASQRASTSAAGQNMQRATRKQLNDAIRGVEKQRIPLGKALEQAGIDQVARYALSGLGLGSLVREISPIMRVLDWLSGTRRGAPRESDVEKAVALLQGAGYQVIPPGPARRGLAPAGPVQAPPGHGSYDVGQPPDSGGGLGGLQRAGTGGPRLPVGTFPGGLYVPMELVAGSSNVYAIGYTEDTLTMRVEYLAASVSVESLRGRGHSGPNRVRGALHKTVLRARHGPGPLYDYHGVPPEVFISIHNSASKGTAIWDELRVRGTVYGHQFDYELVAASKSLVLSQAAFGFGPPRRVGTVTYVPRKAVGPGQFQSRMIRQGNRVFRSLLPSVGMNRPR